ncbi:hypothetical protein Mapa_014804 [Marchantia paleacea]|nr:hypothetical protein Mapa_014804 [Marchantia paleacea]
MLSLRRGSSCQLNQFVSSLCAFWCLSRRRCGPEYGCKNDRRNILSVCSVGGHGAASAQNTAANPKCSNYTCALASNAKVRSRIRLQIWWLEVFANTVGALSCCARRTRVQDYGCTFSLTELLVKSVRA